MPLHPAAAQGAAFPDAADSAPCRILIVKLSSLGDVVHTMPAVQDIHRSMPDARIDWVVERAFAPLVARCTGVHAVIACDLRRWRSAPLTAETRQQWRAFRTQLGTVQYHAVIDAQGLSKSALIARLARLAPGGKRFALANRTRGSSYEAPTRWAADVAVRVDAEMAAVPRARVLCAQALDLAAVPARARYGLIPQRKHAGSVNGHPVVALVHGSSRADKCWPEAAWTALGRRLNAAGWHVGLPHGSERERLAAERIAAPLLHAKVWPHLALDQLVDRMANCAGVIGVDSGLSHIAVALDLPHVQLYNHDTAWRTGPAPGTAGQRAVFAQPAPALDTVWEAWTTVQPALPAVIDPQ